MKMATVSVTTVFRHFFLSSEKSRFIFHRRTRYKAVSIELIENLTCKIKVDGDNGDSDVGDVVMLIT